MASRGSTCCGGVPAATIARLDRMPAGRRLPDPMRTPLRERLQDQGLRDLLEHWSIARGDALVPSLSQLHPARFAGRVPHVWLFGMRPDGAFHCRLAGGVANAAWGRMMMGRSARELLGDAYGRLVTLHWRFVLGRPAIAHTLTPPAHGHTGAEHIVLPVADRTGRPRLVLGATVFDATHPAPRAVDVLAQPTFHLLDGTPSDGGLALLPGNARAVTDP